MCCICVVLVQVACVNISWLVTVGMELHVEICTRPHLCLMVLPLLRLVLVLLVLVVLVQLSTSLPDSPPSIVHLHLVAYLC